MQIYDQKTFICFEIKYQLFFSVFTGTKQFLQIILHLAYFLIRQYADNH